MRPFATAVLALGMTVLPGAAGAQSGLPSFRDEFLGQFDASMQKLVALAEAMPAEKYSWAPGAGVMPVARVYAHIARYNFGYPSENMGAAAPPGIGLDTLERMTDKAQIVALLRRSGDYVRGAVKGAPETDLSSATTLYGRKVPKSAVLFQLVAHMNEHLGQSIAYARSNGIVPPWSK